MIFLYRDDYRDYVDFCFKQFGDRVKHWITLNEPYVFNYYGYSTGTYAPGRCSNYSSTCASGNSATEPYIVAHNLLLSHAAGVKLYKEKYQVFAYLIHYILKKFSIYVQLNN